MTRAEFEKKSSMTNSAWLKKIKGDENYAGTYRFYKILKGTDTEPPLC